MDSNPVSSSLPRDRSPNIAGEASGDLPATAAEGRVFVSYKSEEWHLVQPIVNAVVNSGHEVWYDTPGIPPGEDWTERVGVAIARCRAVLAFVSSAFVLSHYCLRELDEAARLQKRVIVVRVDEVQATELPSAIANLSWIEAGDPDGVAAAVSAALATDAEWLDEHARLHVIGERVLSGGGWSLLLRGGDLRRSAALIARMEGRDEPPLVTSTHRELIRRSKRMRAWTRSAMAVGTAIAGVILMLWYFADQARTVSESQRIASRAESRITDQLDLATHLSLVAVDIDRNNATESALATALTAGPGLRRTVTVSTGVDVARFVDASGALLFADETGHLHFREAFEAPTLRVAELVNVTAISKSASGTTLIGTASGQMAWLDVADLSMSGRCDSGGGRVTAAALTTSGALVAFDTEAGESTIAFVTKNNCDVAHLANAPGVVSDLAVLGDDGSIVVGGGKGVFVVVDGARSEVDIGVRGVSAINVANRGAWIGGDDGTLWWLDRGSLTATRLLAAHDDAIESIRVDEDRLITAGLDGYMRVWDPGNLSMLLEMTNLREDRKPSPLLGTGSLTGDVVLTISSLGVMQQWSLVSDSPLQTQHVSVEVLQGLAVYDGDPIWAGADSVHSETHGPVVLPDVHGSLSALNALDAFAVIGTTTGEVFATNDLSTWSLSSKHDAAVRSVAVAADGAVVSTDGSSVLLRRPGPQDAVPLGTTESYRTVAVGLSGSILAGLEDGGAESWSSNGGYNGRVFETHRGSLDAIAFGPNDDLVATGGDDRLIRLWDADLEQIGTLVGHSERVLSIAISPDQEHLVSVDEGRSMLVWDLVERAQIGGPINHPNDGFVRFLAYSDATVLYAGGPGLLGWEFDIERMREAACKLVGERRLTEAESVQYLGTQRSEHPCHEA